MTEDQFLALEVWMKAIASEPFQKHKYYLPSCRANAYAAMISASPPIEEELVEKVARLIDTHVKARWGCDSVMRYSAWIEDTDIAARAILALLNGDEKVRPIAEAG